MRSDSQENISYTKRVWIKAGIYALVVVLLLLFKATFSVFLLILAGCLICIFFTALTDLICRKTGWKHGLCLTISVLGSIILIALLLWLVGAKIQNQVSELTDSFPSMIDNVKQEISKYPLGEKFIQKVSSPQAMQKAKDTAASFFKSSFGVLGDIYVVLFIAIFFTASPATYKKGLVKLVPKKGQQKAEDVLDTTAENLKKWLKGKLFAMLVVFILTATGLLIMGMPMWLVLALIAGILNFIPNFGPLIALIPAVLVAASQGLNTALIIIGLYTFIQILESNLITPMVQKRLVKIPPALIIIAQLLITPLTTGWGLILATPIMLIIITLVNNLYIKEAN